MQKLKGLFIALTMTATIGATPAFAAQCGNNSGGFNSWKSQFAAEAKANGINNKAISAFMGTSYATKTIHADRNQKSFKLSYEKFKQVRGTATIIKQGRGLKRKHASLFKSIEAKYGVPAGPLIAIWGMETAFGRFTGNQNVLSAVATLAYDCRRSAFFTEHLYHMLKLVGSGRVSANSKGAMHGELRNSIHAEKYHALWRGQPEHPRRRTGFNRQLPQGARLEARCRLSARSTQLRCHPGLERSVRLSAGHCRDGCCHRRQLGAPVTQALCLAMRQQVSQTCRRTLP